MFLMISFRIFPQNQMNKLLNTNKENTSATFYQSYTTPLTDSIFPNSRKHLHSNAYTIEQLTIETQTLLHKLTQKIGLDEFKTQKHCIELSQLNKQIQEYLITTNNDREIDQLVKTQKQVIKASFTHEADRLTSITQKNSNQLKNISQSLTFIHKEIQFEKEQRQESWSKTIDSFEKEIIRMDREFKNARDSQEEQHEQISLDLFKLEEEIQGKIEHEQKVRKQEHQTVVKLVAECIDRVRYIY